MRAGAPHLSLPLWKYVLNYWASTISWNHMSASLQETTVWANLWQRNWVSVVTRDEVVIKEKQNSLTLIVMFSVNSPSTWLTSVTVILPHLWQGRIIAILKDTRDLSGLWLFLGCVWGFPDQVRTYNLLIITEPCVWEPVRGLLEQELIERGEEENQSVCAVETLCNTNPTIFNPLLNTCTFYQYTLPFIY